MSIKILMPVTNTDLIPKLKSHVRILARDRHMEIEVLGLSKDVHQELSRQQMVFIVNSAPKFIHRGDIVFLMAVNNPVMMSMIAVKISERIRKQFAQGHRRWYILEYDPKRKVFNQFFI